MRGFEKIIANVLNLCLYKLHRFDVQQATLLPFNHHAQVKLTCQIRPRKRRFDNRTTNTVAQNPHQMLATSTKQSTASIANGIVNNKNPHHVVGFCVLFVLSTTFFRGLEFPTRKGPFSTQFPLLQQLAILRLLRQGRRLEHGVRCRTC